jgi:hypothetical protein
MAAMNIGRGKLDSGFPPEPHETAARNQRPEDPPALKRERERVALWKIMNRRKRNK